MIDWQVFKDDIYVARFNSAWGTTFDTPTECDKYTKRLLTELHLCWPLDREGFTLKQIAYCQERLANEIPAKDWIQAYNIRLTD